MSAVVVDASVAVKWFLAEPDSEKARWLLASGEVLCAPDLLFADATWRL